MKIKLAAALAAMAMAIQAVAQDPNVYVKLDMRLSMGWFDQGDSRMRAYDRLGRHSVVTLGFLLEPGFDVVIAERFQRIDGDADGEQLDEYYIEDRGYWRVGKQYLPFGRNFVIRDSVYSGRVNLLVGEKGIPISLCYADGGPRRPIGFLVRVGDRIGFSVALGDRFGQSASSLAVVRRPEDSHGQGSGYQQAVGVDFRIRMAPDIIFAFDHASLRQGALEIDVPVDVSDASITWAPDRLRRLEFAYSREWKSRSEFVRIAGEYPIYDGASIEPFIRYKNGRFYDASLTLRIRP